MGYVRVCDLCGKPMSEPGQKYRIKKRWDSWWESCWITIEAHDECADRLLSGKSRSAPPARWIDFEDGSMCSGCGASHNGVNRNYCPNCGADMREEPNE